MKKIAVVGAGIVGLSVAYKMLLKHKNLDLTIFEKEEKLKDLLSNMLENYFVEQIKN